MGCEKKTSAGNVTRRAFVSGVGVAAMSLATVAQVGLAHAEEAASLTSADGDAQSMAGVTYPWAAVPPQIDAANVEEEIDCDVCVLGLGVSGTAAFRSAVEAGAKTVAFEKAEKCSVRSSQYAYVNGTLTEALGLGTVDESEVIKSEWESSARMANYAIIRDFVRNESDVVDWWIAGDEDCYIPQSAEDLEGANPMMGTDAHPTLVYPMANLQNDYKNEEQANYPTVLALTNHFHVVDANKEKAVAAGGTVYFGHFAEQLITDESGRVTGAYVRNAETGKYKKVHAAKGVVMSMGGCGSNKDIVRTFYPSLAENGNLVAWENLDVEGNPTNTGNVYPIAYWAGAGFSQYMAPMCHVMGGPNDVPSMEASSALTSPHLRLNYNGERFMNEDCNCSDCELSFDRQPKRKVFMIVDAHLDEQLTQCIENSGSIADFESKVDNETVFKGETLDELFDAIVAYDPDFKKDAALKSVAHYNDLCAAGEDTDFGKNPKYLFPVQDGPFYAQRMGIGLCLTTMGGVSSDEKAHALSPDHQPVPGLYVSGNSQGDRFAVKYPFRLSGASHAMALYYGYVAGQSAAAGI